MENSNQNLFFGQEEDTLNIRQELHRFVQYWPWFLLCLFIALGSAYFYLRYAPRIYNSNAKIKVLDKNEGLELPTAGFVFNRSNINLGNEIEILTSYIILEKVVKRLNLTTEIYEAGSIGTLLSVIVCRFILR